MTKMINVLVYPADTEIGLEINNALKYVKFIHLVGASPTHRHGRFVYREFIGNLDETDDTRLLQQFNDLIETHQIELIFPASDQMALFFATYEDKLNATVIGSDRVTNEIARSKRLTSEFFADDGILPAYYPTPEQVDTFPVFVKPVIGAGSEGASVVHSREELDHKLADGEDYLITEYLPGHEYTVDCFTDRFGKLCFTGFRERRRVKGGISVNSVDLAIPAAVRAIATIVNRKLNLRGVWFFQVKQNTRGEYRMMEVATRVAGTMCLHRGQGVNLPLLSIYDRLNYPIQIQQNTYHIEVDRALSNKYQLSVEYGTLVIDFDDTITLKGQINPLVMYLLYQVKNRQIPIVLLTRHQHDLAATLARYHVDPQLFDQIHHVTRQTSKGAIVAQYANPIFIDDSFAERDNVLEEVGCPVFDVAAVEGLIDWHA